MKLDDRPVIEQLLDPKPANLLHEVAEGLLDFVGDSCEKTQQAIDAIVFPLLELVPREGQAKAFDVIHRAAIKLCDEEEWRQRALVESFVEAMEARL
jgi:hypothetical protein